MLWPQSSDLSIQSIWWISSVVLDNLIQICRRLIKSISRPTINSSHSIACLRLRRFNPCLLRIIRKETWLLSLTYPQHFFSLTNSPKERRFHPCRKVHHSRNHAYSAMSRSFRKRSVINAVVHVKQNGASCIRTYHTLVLGMLTRQPITFAETTEKTNQDVRRNIFSTCTIFIFLILLYLLQPWLRKKLRYTSHSLEHVSSITYSFSLICLDWVVIADQLRDIMMGSWMYVRC